MPRPNKKVILVGGFAEMIELAEECGRRVVGLIDPYLEGEYRGYPVLGGDDDAQAIHRSYPNVPVVIGLDDPNRRAKLVRHYAKAGFDFANLVHPSAKISASATIGVGVTVHYGAHVSTDARLGDHVRVNVNANLMHDARVGEGTTVAPHALVLGRVTIGSHCYIGAHATILPELTVGNRAQVGAHANVTKSVAAGIVVVGNPARRLR